MRAVRVIGLLVAALVVVVLVGRVLARRTPTDAPVATVPAEAAPAPTPPMELTTSPWCGDGVGTLPSDVCYIDGRGGGSRRTLVIWLHGVIGKDTTWSQDHVKMLSRVAKTTSIEMLFPKGILGPSVYAWPGTAEAQERDEAGLIQQWLAARSMLETREGRPFDESFIFGFSSGAYFASSLAMRGRVDVDGYGIFAGGQAMPTPPTPSSHVVPVFVGVCADDATTASHSRAFAGALAAAGIPHLVNEQNVGHDLSPAHFTGALAFLRKKRQ